MSRKFKSKKKFKKYKIIIYLLISIIIYFFYSYASHISIRKVKRPYLKYLINYYHRYSYNNENKKTPLIDAYDTVKVVLNSPNYLLINDYVYEEANKAIKNEKTKKDTLVYIYNTHQKEGYSNEYIEDYNIVPDVLMMSHIIQEKLNNDGIQTIVEENDITKYLKENDMNYSQSYQASRVFLQQIINSYSTLKLIIDLHRDAASYETSTVEMDSKKYAKVMFVVGKEYDTYQKNLSNTNELNDKIKAKYPLLTRGVLEKSGRGVNGVYNQDLSENIILLELGGDKNNINELTNTIDLIIPIIEEYINEKK